MSLLPSALLDKLQLIEPDAQFTTTLPKVKSSSGNVYFVKLGPASEQEQYAGEAESLNAIHAAAPGLAPRVFASGVDARGKPYFISEYKDLSRLTYDASQILAKRLASELHAYSSPRGFGFHVPTFCGATRLENGWFNTWEECFSTLLGSLADRLARFGSYDDLCKKVSDVRAQVVPKLLGPLKIKPVLLHGDLWSGNVGTDRLTGQPIVFDPSSFYGHNEADLAIARIFGGFPETFFSAYHSYLPKSEPVGEYDLRGDLYELFHYLNHTLLFGGGYAASASRVATALLKSM